MEDEIDTAVDANARPPVRSAIGTRPPPSALPVRIGRYQVLSSLGRGGMAEVFLAELRGPQGFRRHVAIKRLYPTLADDADSVARFVREATIATRLIHPAVCHVYELDEDEHGPRFRTRSRRMRYRALRSHLPLRTCQVLMARCRRTSSSSGRSFTTSPSLGTSRARLALTSSSTGRTSIPTSTQVICR
jgi:serine/threonine protein kinase